MHFKNQVTVGLAKGILKDNGCTIPIVMSPAFKKQIEEMQSTGKAIADALKLQFEQINKAAKAFSELFKEFIEQLNPSMSKLADHGWYVCGSSAMSDSVSLAAKLDKGHIEMVNRFMTDFYEVEFKQILENIKKSHPERKKIIVEAEKAHKLKMYHSSTLLFFSLADGIFDGHLFTSRNKKESLKKILKKTRHIKEHGELLVKLSPVNANYGELSQFHNPLNRHKTMHGGDVQYGTKINSLKAFSLLAFISDFFDEIEE